MDRTRLLVSAVCLALSTAVACGDSFYPISGITSSTAATDYWPATNLIQGPGVGFQATAPYDKLLSAGAGDWVTAAPGGFPADYIAVAGTPVLALDLGADVLLSEISVWGYATTNANGVSEFSLQFATAAEGTGGFGTSIGYNPTFSPTMDNTSRQSFAFSQNVTARYVELTALDNFFAAPGDGSDGGTPGGDRVGLGEIAFEEIRGDAIPEPATFALIVIGAAGVGRYVQRRRKA